MKIRGRPTRLAQSAASVLLACALYGLSAPASALTIEQQRSAFRDAYPAAERGDWSVAASHLAELQDYVLWPDLRGAYLEAGIKTADAREIDHFLSKHADTRAARELRYRYIKELARRKNWKKFLVIYDAHYRDRNITVLDCLAMRARIKFGNTASARGPALALWNVGKSQPKECDRLFAYLQQKTLLTPERIRTRMLLAIDEREFSLAAHLAKRLDDDSSKIVALWQAFHREPKNQLIQHRSFRDSERARDMLAYGIRRLARRDAMYAQRLWTTIDRRFSFSDEDSFEIQRYIAIRAAINDEAGATALLQQLPAGAVTDDVRLRRVRAALRSQDWPEIVVATGGMSEALSSEQTWMYWRARALAEVGETEAANTLFATLAEERSYHGFLAADRLDLPYQYSDIPTAADNDTQQRLAANPALIRARELFFTGLNSKARSAWHAVVSALPAEEKLQAALLAHSWDWHSQAISAVAQARAFDDLALRYPTPWRQWFATYSQAAGIESTWAYSIARSESLFMRDVRSSAGAIGVMQLMPDTGRRTAKKIRLKYRGNETLTDPKSNITLGTYYLGQMKKRFSGNTILATAAYNAGPHRVDRWMKTDSNLPTDIWIETVPFNETRKYVQRVLAAKTVFHWRMTGQTRRVSHLLNASTEPAPVIQVAGTD